MLHNCIISLNRHVTYKIDAEKILLKCGDHTFNFKNPDSWLPILLTQLADGGGRVDDLWKKIADADSTAEETHFHFFIIQLSQKGLIRYALQQDDKTLITLEPMTADFEFATLPDLTTTRWRLSRFVYLHAVDNQMILESPLSNVRLCVNDPNISAWVTYLTNSRNQQQLQLAFPMITTESQITLLQMLYTAAIIAPVDSENKLPEDHAATLQQWEFHDLLFHSRSRLGRHDYAYGGSFRFLNQLELMPPTKPPMSTNLIALQKPEPAIFMRDPPLQTVLESRQSIRRAAKEPLTLIQLGEFLYRSARITSVYNSDENNKKIYAGTSRPYPNAGAMYELEIYLSVRRCANLAPGLYHYDPQTHQLELLMSDSPAVQNHFTAAALRSGTDYIPDVLIIITARFSRIQWKYASMAYASILKNVGALYQTFYLAATAMQLAPCAIGGGNSDNFVKLTGLDYYAESSVGEFLLSNLDRPL